MNWLVLNGFSLSALRGLVNRGALWSLVAGRPIIELLRWCARVMLYGPMETITELLATPFDVRIMV